jgi:antitoxin component YwqK of YwqJK toxin-antitoxin module
MRIESLYMTSFPDFSKSPVPSQARLLCLLACLSAGGLALVFFAGRPGLPLPEVERPALVLRDGTLYRQDETLPFAGFMFERHENGSLKSRSAVSNGKLNGVSDGWHTNGALQVREHFKDGVSHGSREKWHATGKKMSEAVIVGGKLHGPFQRWHENGRLAEQIKMKDGHPDGTAWAYYPSGFLKMEAHLQNGNVLGQKSWKDGEAQAPEPLPVSQ